MLLSSSYVSSKGDVGGGRHSSLRGCRGERGIGYRVVAGAISCDRLPCAYAKPEALCIASEGEVRSMMNVHVDL